MCETWEEGEARFLPNCSLSHIAAFRRDPPALPADNVSSLKYFGEGEREEHAQELSDLLGSTKNV